jgi:hypothetical protein
MGNECPASATKRGVSAEEVYGCGWKIYVWSLGVMSRWAVIPYELLKRFCIEVNCSVDFWVSFKGNGEVFTLSKSLWNPSQSIRPSMRNGFLVIGMGIVSRSIYTGLWSEERSWAKVAAPWSGVRFEDIKKSWRSGRFRGLVANSWGDEER